MSGMLEGVQFSCTAGSMDFSITQTGGSFSGVQTGTGRLVCSTASEIVVDTFISGETIVNGQITGSSLTFRLGSIDGAHSATVSGTSMTGNAHWLFEDGPTLSGQFTAVKM